jgi:uncharacterized protein YjbJ (UPF0337 family)
MTKERDRYEGKGKEALGSLKEKAGEVSGDEEMEAEGKGEKYEGKGQEAWGESQRDHARDEGEGDRLTPRRTRTKTPQHAGSCPAIFGIRPPSSFGNGRP